LPDARKLAGDLPVPEYLIEEQLKKDPTYDKLAKDVAQLQAALADAKERYTKPKNEPAYKRVVADLEVAKPQLDARRLAMWPHIIEELFEKLARDVSGGKGTAQKRMAFMEKLIEELGAQVQTLEVEIQAPPRIKRLEETVVMDDGNRRMKL